MRITKFDCITVALPYTHDGPLTGFGGADWPNLPYLLVRVETEDGLVGWGEAFGYTVIPATREILLNQVKPLAMQCDATDIAGTMEHLQKTLHIFGRGGPTQFALAGLDIALWDLAGKRAGMPVAQLLGGMRRRSIEAYTSLLKLNEPAIVAKACEKAMERGFRAVKLHEKTVPAISAAREALGPDIPLMVDVNCAWSLSEAEEICRKLIDLDLFWLEEPTWPPEDLSAMARLRERFDIPLAAGENIPNAWAFEPYAQSQVIDFLQPSVTKVGGITEMMKVVRSAEMCSLRIAPHSPYFGPGLLATLHIAAHTPLIDRIECFGVQLGDTLYGAGGFPDSSGLFHVSDRPGLGFDPDPEAIERCRIDR